MSGLTVGVVGNPNCGKTTLFNALTGSRQHVGNWPGVTVEKKFGEVRINGETCQVVDLPGVYSLGVTSNASEDERVARDYVLSGDADLVVNIIDASNLERNLYLTVQLLEMRIPMVVALNMMDIARDRGVIVDPQAMAEKLGCPVVGLVATRKSGVESLKQAIMTAAAAPRPPKAFPVFASVVESAIAALLPQVKTALVERADAAGLQPGATPELAGDPRWLSVKLLEGDFGAQNLFKGRLDAVVAEQSASIEAEYGEEPDIVIADGRFSFVGEIVSACAHRPHVASRHLSDRIDGVVLNRVLGIPVFLGIMYMMFMFTINVGGAFIDFFDKAFGAVLIDGLSDLLTGIGAPSWLTVLLAKGAGGGVQTIATFIPVIGSLFLFLSWLEDSGYMARASFVMDRAMRAIGLPGKSFVPLIVGFGCNVPAIMVTRTLEHRRDRIITILMAPFMSCGARLPVYALFAAAFFPESGQNVVFALYLIGLAFAIGTGLLLKNTLLKGEASSFVMELPPYHMPTFGSVGRRAWHRLSDFIFRAGQMIVPMVIVLTFLSSVDDRGNFNNDVRENSVLAVVGRSVIPIFEPMGMTEQNWPAAVGLFTGVFAKEAVVGTLNTLYKQAGGAVEAETASVGLVGKLQEALQTIPDNLGKLAQRFGDPLGVSGLISSDRVKAGEELKVDVAAFGAMTERFDGAAGAFAFLLLILLYMPCVAATGAINQEIGWRWTLFSAGWCTGLGYCASVIFYQSALLMTTPAAAMIRIVVAVAAVVFAVIVMRMVGAREARRVVVVAAE
ncbi:Fe(2(+)) transporter FeoB [Azospirillaceae bacterium]